MEDVVNILASIVILIDAVAALKAQSDGDIQLATWYLAQAILIAVSVGNLTASL
jgi:hypothetical protein